jgi:EmrB/QacA subfamily drug resistance transporter
VVFGGLLLAMFMAAIEATIVATAMPSIAGELGGFALYSWVFSSFLLMQAVAIPIFGKLADLLGRKPIFIFGILVFLVGSILCGFANSMGALIGYRFLQGLGAGAVQPIAVTLAGDLYSLEERGRIQGYMSGLWGISSILGPLAGGLIVHTIGWSWIFWINLPFGAASIAIIAIFLHEKVERGEERYIDYAGGGLLLVAVGAILLALTQLGTWNAATILAMMCASAVALAFFVRQELRAPDPLMHIDLWRNGLIRYANLAALTSGMIMIGLISFLPTYVQGVKGGSALLGGFTLSAMTLGWPLAAFIAGARIARLGVLRFVRGGGLALVVGTFIIAGFTSAPAFIAGLGSFVVGIGLGLINTTTLVAIQASVSWSQRGVATASNMLMRILGNALGAALFGGLLNYQMRGRLAADGQAGDVSLDDLDLLLGEGGASAIDPGVLDGLRDALSGSLGTVFWGIAIAAMITLTLAWRIPELRRDSIPEKPEPVAA